MDVCQLWKQGKGLGDRQNGDRYGTCEVAEVPVGTEGITMECFAACVALREQTSIAARLKELGREPRSSWRDREISDLQGYLLEVDHAIARHRDTARSREH